MILRNYRRDEPDHSDPDVDEIPVRYLNVRHFWNFYDHPLDGVCLIDGRWYWFERDHDSDVAVVRPMTRWRCVKEWCHWLLFYRMVGGHTTLLAGKRGEYVGHKGRLGKALERFYFYMYRRYK